ncbi:SH3 domain-containing protein [Aquimarina hainanensis]|uniref:SH3 domain-containing protein n=1 Tax=Aquimarina hainanensis TaxID=1578017 RepID=A0ABW5N644_9FLAO|nr:SH3 domain-containing protein [Aquimarina sp. TRL1]QKX04782.1 SH3 domain-containing protein [Aquimarina sp. TRL1]
MKRIIYIIVLLCSAIVTAQGQTFLEQANALYTSEKYQEAINMYMKVIDQKQEESVALYYNLANAHYKLSNIGPSIYYYEKALKLDPSDSDVLNNLAFAQKATIDKIDSMPEGVITKVIKSVTNLFTFDGWAWISVIGIILFVVLFFLYSSATIAMRKRFFFIGAWAMFFIGFWAVFMAFRQYDYVTENQFAVIFSSEAEVKSEPNLKSERVFELHEGTKVKVLETVNDWKKIRLTDGKIGWMPADNLKEL